MLLDSIENDDPISLLYGVILLIVFSSIAIYSSVNGDMENVQILIIKLIAKKLFF